MERERAITAVLYGCCEDAVKDVHALFQYSFTKLYYALKIHPVAETHSIPTFVYQEYCTLACIYTSNCTITFL